MRAASFLAAALLSGSALAQDNSTTTIPAPGAERYSLPPGANQPTPTPTPTPAPSVSTPGLTPAPPPSVVPTLQVSPPEPGVAPTPTPAEPTARPTRARAVARSSVGPSVEPPPITAPTATPDPLATPTPVSTESAAVPVAAAPASGPPPWLWWALGLALVAVAAALVWRRFAGGRSEPLEYVAEPAAPAPPTPSPPARPVVAPQPAQAVVLDFRPQRLWTLGPDAHLAFELVVTNTGATPIDAVRPVIALASAGPDTAAEIAAFQANAPTLPGGEPFALRGGETRSIAGELTLPGDVMYVTSAADRELIVPVALVSLGWRAGLSLARANEAFVIGTGDATSARLGPIWVDRAGLVYAKLDARRFTPGPR